MKSDKLIKSASFNPKVKQYWLVFWILLSVVTIAMIPTLPLVIILVLAFSQKVLDAMSADLYERKLVVKKGIFVKTEKSIPLEKITDVGMVQGPLMRMFGICKLDFETAGQSGAGALVSLLGINDAEEFRESILKQKDHINDIPMTKTDAPSKALSEDAVMVEILEALKRIEAIIDKKS